MEFFDDYPKKLQNIPLERLHPFNKDSLRRVCLPDAAAIVNHLMRRLLLFFSHCLSCALLTYSRLLR
eukprot:29646-Pleurochrysis_carterae.AAC.1